MLVLQTRQALTPEQINEACYVDMNANKAVFDSLAKNPKVNYDGMRFSYKVLFEQWPWYQLDIFTHSYFGVITYVHLKFLPVQA